MKMILILTTEQICNLIQRVLSFTIPKKMDLSCPKISKITTIGGKCSMHGCTERKMQLKSTTVIYFLMRIHWNNFIRLIRLIFPNIWSYSNRWTLTYIKFIVVIQIKCCSWMSLYIPSIYRYVPFMRTMQ